MGLSAKSHTEDTRIVCCTTSGFYRKLIKHPRFSLLYKLRGFINTSCNGRVIAFAGRYKGKPVWTIRDEDGIVSRVRRDSRMVDYTYIILRK